MSKVLITIITKIVIIVIINLFKLKGSASQYNCKLSLKVISDIKIIKNKKKRKR